MQINNRILTILGTLKTDSIITDVVYEVPSTANIVLDNKQMPLALVFCVEGWKVSANSGLAQESADVSVFIIDRVSKLDFSGTNVSTKIASCSNIAMAVIARIMADSKLQIESDVDVKAIYPESFDTAECGVNIKFSCKYNGSKCVSSMDIQPEDDGE